MSDVTITTLIVVPVVIGTIAIIGYSLHWSELRDVEKLLPLIKCICGHSPLTWNGGLWLVDGHCHDFDDDIDHYANDAANDDVAFGAGFVFDCSRCHRSLSFTYKGRLDSVEDPALENAT